MSQGTHTSFQKSHFKQHKREKAQIWHLAAVGYTSEQHNVWTHDVTDAILSNGPFGYDHQVGFDAPLPQVVAAFASITRLHIKLTVQTLHGALWYVNATGSKHTEKSKRWHSQIQQPVFMPEKQMCRCDC